MSSAQDKVCALLIYGSRGRGPQNRGAVPPGHPTMRCSGAESVLQVLSPKDACRALQNIAAVLNPGGRIFIIGQILDDSRRSPLEAVGFNLSFINFFDAGESYTKSEHREWLTAAGFVDIERSLLADGGSLMAARKLK